MDKFVFSMLLLFHEVIQLLNIVGHGYSDDSDSLDVVVEEILDFLLCGSLRQVCDHDAEVGSCVSLDVDHFVLIGEPVLKNCQQNIHQQHE